MIAVTKKNWDDLCAHADALLEIVERFEILYAEDNGSISVFDDAARARHAYNSFRGR